MNKDLEANEEMPKVKRSKARTKSYIDAGPPQLKEAASVTSQSESEPPNVEATPAEDVIDGGPAPAAPSAP